MQINSCVIQAPPSGPPPSTLSVPIPSSHSQEHLWPSPFYNFPSLMFSCSSMFQAGSRVSPRYPLPQRTHPSLHRVQPGAKTLSTVPYPLGPRALRHFWDLAQLKQGTVGKSQSPVKNEDQPPSHTPPLASTPNSVQPTQQVPATSSLSPP